MLTAVFSPGEAGGVELVVELVCNIVRWGFMLVGAIIQAANDAIPWLESLRRFEVSKQARGRHN